MPGEFRGKIPGSAVRPKRLRYTLEVTGEEGEVLAKLGRGGGGGKDAEVEPWSVRVTEPDGPEEPEMPDLRKPKKRMREPRFMVAVGLGTGFALVEGKSDGAFEGSTRRVDIKRGFATSPFHSGLELGYLVTPSIELGLAARFQIVPDFTIGIEPRFRWLPLNEGLIRPYFQAGVSFIKVRNNVSLDPVVPGKSDTITAGDFGIGVGGGISFQVSRTVGIGVELHTMTIVPDLTLAIDVDLRLRFRF
jgi:hypothetical protein